MYVITKEEYQNFKNNGRNGNQYNDSIGRDVNGGQVNHIELGEGGRVVIKPNDVIASSKSIPSRDKMTIPDEAFQNWPKHPPYEKNDMNINEQSKISSLETISDNNSSKETELKTLDNGFGENKNELDMDNSLERNYQENKDEEPGEKSQNTSSINEKPKKLDATSSDPSSKEQKVPPVITGDPPAVSPKNSTDGQQTDENKNLPLIVQQRPIILPSPTSEKEGVTNEEENFRRRQPLPDDDEEMQKVVNETVNDISNHHKSIMNQLRESRIKKIMYDDKERPNIFRKTGKKTEKNLAQDLKNKSRVKSKPIGKNDIMVVNPQHKQQMPSLKKHVVKVSTPKSIDEIRNIIKLKPSIKKQKKDQSLKQIKSVTDMKKIKDQTKQKEKSVIKSLVNARLMVLNRANQEKIRMGKQSKNNQDNKNTQEKKSRKRRQDSITSEDTTNYIPTKVKLLSKRQMKNKS